MLFSSQPISRPNNLCVEPSPLRHNWETGNGKFLKLDRGRFRREAEKARPEKPEGSTEGQAGLRARRRAWPSVPIGLVPIVRVVLVGQSREAVVTAQRPVRGDRLITSSACRWTMGPGRRSVQPDHRRKLRSGAMGWKLRSCPLMAPLMPPEQEPNCRWRGFDFPGGGFDFPGAASISQTGVSSACIFLLSKNLKCSFS